MVDRETQLQAEDDVRSMGLEQMRRERVLLASELKSIESQISDLAFNNYGTYADAGRATHDCSKTFGELRDKTVDLSTDVEELTTAFQEFRAKAKSLSAEQELIRKALDKSNPIWELLSLPSRMDICIRAGYYDLAYSLTNYGMQLQQQSQLIKNPLIKKVADRLVEARSYLLEELFNKFAGPLDLAESIKVVNNVRKMPYLTANQLRISVLQHRDIYLDKQILDISGNADMVMQAIEVYRTCMYDTLVLYLAVFPETEVVRKDPSADPRWEPWPVLTPSAILSQWAIANVKRLLDLIQRADMKSAIDLSSVWSKLMTMASSFGRMGIDFRPLVGSRLTNIVESRFRNQVKEATQKLTGTARSIVMIGIDPASLPQFDLAPDAPPVPAAELSLWDDVTVYANSIVDALNGLRFMLTPVVLSTVVTSLRDSVRSILSHLATSHATSPNFSRAVRIICLCLAPFFEKCVIFFFPAATMTKIFGSSISKQQYDQFVEFDVKQLAASSDEPEKIEEVLLPLLQKKKLADINLDEVLKKKAESGGDSREGSNSNSAGEHEVTNQHQPKFFLEQSPDTDDSQATEISVPVELETEKLPTINEHSPRPSDEILPENDGRTSIPDSHKPEKVSILENTNTVNESESQNIDVSEPVKAEAPSIASAPDHQNRNITPNPDPVYPEVKPEAEEAPAAGPITTGKIVPEPTHPTVLSSKVNEPVLPAISEKSEPEDLPFDTTQDNDSELDADEHKEETEENAPSIAIIDTAPVGTLNLNSPNPITMSESKPELEPEPEPEPISNEKSEVEEEEKPIQSRQKAQKLESICLDDEPKADTVVEQEFQEESGWNDEAGEDWGWEEKDAQELNLYDDEDDVEETTTAAVVIPKKGGKAD